MARRRVARERERPDVVPAGAGAAPGPPAGLLALQRLAGNRAVAALVGAATPAPRHAGAAGARTPAPVTAACPPLRPVLPQLTISSPTDDCEREADRVAGAVVDRERPVAGAATGVADHRDRVHRQEDGRPGQALPVATRGQMESQFGHDFSGVRIHADADADRAARSVHASAFTVGRDIYFQGGFDPGSASGRRLLAHELTHVVQQAGGDQGGERVERTASLRPEIHALPDARRAALLRATEIHVNLRVPQHVRLYEGSEAAQTFLTSAGEGNKTSKLIPHSPLSVTRKVGPPPARTPKYGLQYYAQFTSGGHAFHSNICYPRARDRRRTVLDVDGTPHSNGCLRLHHPAARTVFNALSTGDEVHIYNERRFRPPSWEERAAADPITGRTYTVQEGDTLSGIGERAGVPWQDIARANNIDDPTSIRAGQVLTIPR